MFEPGTAVVIPFPYSDFLAMPLTSQPPVGEAARREYVRRLCQHLQPEH